jgi:tRNA threonylcarbamoyladenosine modification (KEOPS) complex Cgi121 subunit
MRTPHVLIAQVSVDSAGAEAELLRLRREHPDLVVQMASVKKLPPAKSVRMIAEQTLRAKETHALLASRPEVDLLLRLAGTSQISVAIRTSGHQAPGRKLLVAAGTAAGTAKLEKTLRSDKRYSIIEGDEMGKEGIMMVEKAALLGTRV